MSLDAQAAAPHATRHAVRPFYWSVRRELWENRSVWFAPLAVAAVILAAFVYASHGLAHELRIAAHLTAAVPPPNLPAKMIPGWIATAPARSAFALVIPYMAAAFAMLATATVVGVFYCLGSLYGERRDRTVLFWKSLPVSDWVTVLSKAIVPFVILPVLAIAAMTALMLLLMAVSAVALSGSGLSMDQLLQFTQVGRIAGLAAYAIVCQALWWAPLIGWLMAVSAWARQATFVWALAPPAAVCLFERLALGTSYASRFVSWRLNGGLNIAFAAAAKNPHKLPDFADLRPLDFVASPGLWGGLVAFALLLAACVWLRRRRDPI